MIEYNKQNTKDQNEDYLNDDIILFPTEID